MSVDRMLISILSVSMESPWAWDLNLTTCLAPCVECATSGIQTCPVSTSDVPSSLLGLVQTLTVSACHNSPLRLKTGLAHLDRQLVTVGESLPETLLPCFVFELFIFFVVQLLVMFHEISFCLLVRVCKKYIGHVALLVV